MTSPKTVWFRLTLDDADLAEYYTVKAWLDEVGKRIRTVLAESNFYTSHRHALRGPRRLRHRRDDHLRGLRRRHPLLQHLRRRVLPRQQRAHGDRHDVPLFVQTTRQVGKRFGEENVSPTIQSALRQKGASLAREVMVAHAIEPNDDLTERLAQMKGRPFREVYWEWGSSKQKFLSVRGFYENPVIAARWAIFGNDAYGRGPGMDVLGDIKQLQVQQKRKAQAIDKMVNPPLVADVQLKNEPASLLPGGVTYVQMIGSGSSSKPGMSPVYEVKPDLSQMVEDMNDVRSRIKTGFFEDLFMLWANMEGVQPRNELEIIERKSEKLIQIGPVIERFENEALDPAIERTFNIMNRAGLLPPPPRELRPGQPVKIEYVSMLAQAQKAAMTTGLEQLAAFVGRISALNNTVADNVDWDEAVQQYADHIGTPVKMLRPYADVLKMRQQRAKEAGDGAGRRAQHGRRQGAKVMSETNVGGGRNALESMVGA
jgi:hypothetical protein